MQGVLDTVRRHPAWLALVVGGVGLIGCSSYDAGLLHSAPRKQHDMAGSGGGSLVDAASDANATRGDAASDAAADGATGTDPVTCHPNPDVTNEVCPEVCPETCNDKDDDCDLRVDEGDSARNCAVPHAAAACRKGVCLVATCDPGYRDCDKSPENGCEAGTDDVYNCGACAHACDIPDAVAACKAGVCVVAACSPGFASCDQDPATCETPTTTLSNCGKCGKTCPALENATHTCASGSCKVEGCLGNFGNCDGIAANGCETELVTTKDCGACGVPCVFGSAQGDCSSGVCVGTSCDVGFGPCDGNDANGCEPLDTASNCGGCGLPCSVTSAQNVTAVDCATRTCTVTCATGFLDCDGNTRNGCETTPDIVEHCGGCAACRDLPHASASCDKATRTCKNSCDQGFADCTAAPGCETSIRTLTNCGGCSVTCNKDNCNSGVCTNIDCSTMPGKADCDGDGTSCETDLSSLMHCGSCSNACAFNASITAHASLACMAQGCKVTCDAGFDDCDGDYKTGCEATLVSTNNCGACGVSCAITNATATCSTGQCRVQSCAPDYADCNNDKTSCETPLNTVANCGTCGKVCSFPNAIPACGGSVGARTCGIASCADANHADCDLDPTNGCERDIRPVASGGEGPCVPDTGCTKRSNLGHDYYTCTTARNWADAQSHCRSQLRGDLAQIADATEKTFVTAGITATSWLGHNDILNEGLWVWSSNNVPFWQGTSTGATVLGQYANWSGGEPNASGDCGALYTSGAFDDTTCTLTMPYVCEVSPDACPSDASKYDPGQCGCGSADTDADADGFAVCNDGCDADANKRAPGVCGCGVADTNTDGDSAADCKETCPTDPLKLAPGVCGCGTPDTDTDSDGFKDCIENCDSDPAKQDPGACGCGTADTNTDGDSAADCNETCDTDPLKLAPGQCGCGTPDTDSDGDGTANCHDACPNDNPKIAPGVCGCAVADTDSDGDGTPNCHDACPNNSPKIAAGQCGCAVADTDDDSDGTANCNDGCPIDPLATSGPPCYRSQTITIQNTSATALTSYQVQLTLPSTNPIFTAGHLANAAGNDIRILQSNGTTAVPYWIETLNSGATATKGRIWVQVTVPATSTITIYLNYGDPALASSPLSNIHSVMEWGDDFSGTANAKPSSTYWNGTLPAPTIAKLSGSGELLYQNTGTKSTGRLTSTYVASAPIVQETKMKTVTKAANGVMGGGFYSALGDNFGALIDGSTADGVDYYYINGAPTGFAGSVMGVDYRLTIQASGTTVSDTLTNYATGAAVYNYTGLTHTVASDRVAIGFMYEDSATLTNQANDTRFDWIFTRKYAATLPTVTVPGTETR